MGTSGPAAIVGRSAYAEPTDDGGWDDASDGGMYTDERASAYGEAYGERYDTGYDAGERSGGYDEAYGDPSEYGPAYGGQKADGNQGEYAEAYDETGYDDQGYDDQGYDGRGLGGGGYDYYGSGVPDGWGPQEQDEPRGGEQQGGWKRLFGRR
jgi:hypothetical protein